MILNPFNCSVADQRHFDTFTEGASKDLVAYLDNLHTGALLIGVTGDEPTGRLKSALSWLQAAGVQVGDVRWRGSFAFVIQIGYPENTVYAKSINNTVSRTTDLNVTVTG